MVPMKETRDTLRPMPRADDDSLTTTTSTFSALGAVHPSGPLGFCLCPWFLNFNNLSVLLTSDFLSSCKDFQAAILVSLLVFAAWAVRIAIMIWRPVEVS